MSSSKFRQLISKLKLPIIQAPMAGGINNPTSVAAVCNSGGIGSFGFAYTSSEDIKRFMTETRSKTTGPIHANFFVFPTSIHVTEQNNIDSINTLYSKAQISIPFASAPSAPYSPALSPSLAALWPTCPALISFHFGIPEAKYVEEARSHNVLVGMTATSVEDAQEIVQAGADYIIAQGIEAGGHRGYLYTVNGVDRDLNTILRNDHKLSTLDLVRGIVNSGITLPVVAAGGIMKGADIRTMINGGAAAVQMGTAFLACDESSASPAHKRYLLQQGHHRGTVYTNAFSGRHAQAIRNEFISAMATDSSDGENGQVSLLPFPAQNTLTGVMRKAAVQRDDGEFQSLYAGSRYALTRGVSTADLMAQLTQEYEEAV